MLTANAAGLPRRPLVQPASAADNLSVPFRLLSGAIAMTQQCKRLIIRVRPRAAVHKIRSMLEKTAEESPPEKRAGILACIERLERMARRELPSVPQAITLRLLKRTPDNNLYSMLCDYVRVCLFDDPSVDSDTVLGRLPKGLQHVWHFAGIEYEVPNGGFNQFFSNCSGKFALETIEALRAVGVKGEAEILEKAIKLFEKHVGRPASSRERWYGDPCPEEPLDPLERQFCELVESQASRIVQYVRKHPGQFLHIRRAKTK
jgi:hypothetical protein